MLARVRSNPHIKYAMAYIGIVSFSARDPHRMMRRESAGLRGMDLGLQFGTLRRSHLGEKVGGASRTGRRNRFSGRDRMD